MIKTICTPEGCQHIELTAEEQAALLADQAAMQAELSAQELKAAAHVALAKSDSVALRCVKAGAAFPSAWQDYVAELRAIVNGAVEPLPAQPDFLAGT
jgi:hypothetical protein